MATISPTVAIAAPTVAIAAMARMFAQSTAGIGITWDMIIATAHVGLFGCINGHMRHWIFGTAPAPQPGFIEVAALQKGDAGVFEVSRLQTITARVDQAAAQRPAGPLTF
jgi:hypothetical protein